MAKRIVLLHGWGASSQKLEPLEQELKKLGWETVNLKLPGFELKDPDITWTVEDYADFVVGNIPTKWKGDFAIFGHSFGGRLAIRLATKGIGTSLVLCACGGLSRPSGLKRAVFAGIAKLGNLLGLQKYKGLLYKIVGEHDYEKTLGVMRETFKKVIEEDLRPELTSIHQPTLILWGKQDRMVPYTDGVFTSKRIPNSKLVLFDNQGHRLPYEQPQVVAQEIETWWK